MISRPLPDTNITQYIPQRAPIIMIDTLLESEGAITVTFFLVKEDGLFMAEGVLKEPGLIENIAQTAAAGVGYQFALKNEPVPSGFIGAIKNLQIHHLPEVGQRISTRVEILEEVFGITLIKGEISLEGKIIVSCEMKIVLKS